MSMRPFVRRSPLALAVAGILWGHTTLAGTVSGRVSDGSGIKALQSAQVEIVELGRRAETAADGSFRFADVPDGSYTLRARYVGSEPAQTNLKVAGDTRNADIRMGDASAYVDNVLVVGQRAACPIRSADRR